MMTASSIRSAWEKLSAITCSALIESGLLVMLPSEVNADPIRVADGHDRGSQDQSPRGQDPPGVDG